MRNLSEEVNSKQFLFSIKVIHIALMAGVFLFMVIVSTVFTDPTAPVIQEDFDLFKYIVPGMALAGIVLSPLIGNKILERVNDKPLKAKLGIYQTSMIARLALYEMAALFAIVAALLANAHIFFSVVLIMLVLMYLQ